MYIQSDLRIRNEHLPEPKSRYAAIIQTRTLSLCVCVCVPEHGEYVSGAGRVFASVKACTELS